LSTSGAQDAPEHAPVPGVDDGVDGPGVALLELHRGLGLGLEGGEVPGEPFDGHLQLARLLHELLLGGLLLEYRVLQLLDATLLGGGRLGDVRGGEVQVLQLELQGLDPLLQLRQFHGGALHLVAGPVPLQGQGVLVLEHLVVLLAGLGDVPLEGLDVLGALAGHAVGLVQLCLQVLDVLLVDAHVVVVPVQLLLVHRQLLADAP
jgi:hypothetical protein